MFARHSRELLGISGSLLHHARFESHEWVLLTIKPVGSQDFANRSTLSRLAGIQQDSDRFNPMLRLPNQRETHVCETEVYRHVVRPLPTAVLQKPHQDLRIRAGN